MVQTIFMFGVRVLVPVAIGIVGLGTASGCSREPGAGSPTSPTSPTGTPPGLTHYSLSGTVTDEQGAVIPNMPVAVNFDPDARMSGCRIRACWVLVHT